jgi:hypothetical protein
MNHRLPPLAPHAMSEEQAAAAAELAAGPRGGVRGPFIALLRSPELMRRLQKVGEYLRYQSALEPRLSEFAMGERALVELVALVGYFITVSLVLNVAHTPAAGGASPLEPFPR